MMSGKVGTSANKMVYPEGTILWWGLFTPNFRTIAYVIDKHSGMCVPSVKTTTYVCNGFNTSFCTEDRKTHMAISILNWIVLNQINSNLGGISRNSFLPPCPTEIMIMSFRSSRPEVFLGKGFAKQLYWNHISAWVFPCKFVTYFQNTFC